MFQIIEASLNKREREKQHETQDREGLRGLKLMLTRAQMSATFQSRSNDPPLIAPSLN